VIAVVVFAALVLYEEFESRVMCRSCRRALRLPSAVVFFSLIVGAVLAASSAPCWRCRWSRRL